MTTSQLSSARDGALVKLTVDMSVAQAAVTRGFERGKMDNLLC
jgi:hypothetical protein